MNYPELVYLFLDLRKQGLSLSSVDLDLLHQWESEQLDPEFIAQVMIEVAHECAAKNKPFPLNLVSIHRRVRRVMQKSMEY